MPPTGENGAHGRRRRQGFRPKVPRPNKTPGLDDPVASHHHRRKCVTPRPCLQRGNDVPAAHGSRTAVSAAIPSERAARGTIDAVPPHAPTTRTLPWPRSTPAPVKVLQAGTRPAHRRPSEARRATEAPQAAGA